MDANEILRELLRTRLGGKPRNPQNLPPNFPWGRRHTPPLQAPTP
jgi:hypothetical protein